MLTSLTLEQKDKIQEYKEKYTQIALNTDRIDKEQCVQDINEIYEKVLDRKKPDKIIICQSPLQAWYLLCFYKYLEKITKDIHNMEGKKGKIKRLIKEIYPETCSKIRSIIWPKMRSKIHSQIRLDIWAEIYPDIDPKIFSKMRSIIYSETDLQICSDIWSEIYLDIWTKVPSEIDPEFRSKILSKMRVEINSIIYSGIGSTIHSDIRLELCSSIWSEVHTGMKYIYPYLWGNMDSYWFGYVDYMRDVLGIEFGTCIEEYEIYKKEINYHSIYPLKDICFVSEKPVEINIENERLHADGQPAILYEDGFSFW